MSQGVGLWSTNSSFILIGKSSLPNSIIIVFLPLLKIMALNVRLWACLFYHVSYRTPYLAAPEIERGAGKAHFRCLRMLPLVYHRLLKKKKKKTHPINWTAS